MASVVNSLEATIAAVAYHHLRRVEEGVGVDQLA